MKTCRHPDRDVPKIVCGHPLPCPYHTAVIEHGVAIVPEHVGTRKTRPRIVRRVQQLAKAIGKG